MANPLTKDDAQRRADQIRAFWAEVAQLGREGLEPLTSAQRDALQAHHDALLAALAREFDIDRTVGEKRMSLGMRLASTLGAAAIIAAIVSFFYRVWGTLPTTAQVVLLTSAPLAAVAAMVVAVRRERTLYVASLCAIVACGAFVTQTIMLGSSFNLRGSPHVLAWWGLFFLAIALPWRFAIPFLAGAVSLVAYGAALGMFVRGAPWQEFRGYPETLLLPTCVALAVTVRVPLELRAWLRGGALVVMLGAILVLSAAGSASLLPVTARAAEIGYQIVAVVLAVGVIGAGLRSGWSETVTIGAVFAGLFLLTRFVDWWWDWMPKYLFFLILAAVALGWLWLLRILRQRLVEAQT
jgi:hypothetical protein